MFQFALLISLISAPQESPTTYWPLRFIPDDVCRFSETAFKAYMQIREATSKARDLSVECANGILGAVDRVHLNSQYNETLDNIRDLINRSKFEDSFHSAHYFIHDGITFDALFQSQYSGQSYARTVRIESSKNLGSIASKEFALIIKPADQRTALTINNQIITSPDRNDDHFSQSQQENSAIAWATQINAASHRTGVYADVATNIFLTGRINEKELPSTLGQELVINGVRVSGEVQTTHNLIQAINNVFNQTGVKARLVAYKIDQIEIYAEDGRNISLKVGEKLASSFETNIPPNERYTKLSNLKFRSKKPFTLKGGPFHFEGEELVNLDPDQNLFYTNILMQDTAAEAFPKIDSAIAHIDEKLITAELLRATCNR